jgi:2OG-Fe(II) oxygenase superfamily
LDNEVSEKESLPPMKYPACFALALRARRVVHGLAASGKHEFLKHSDLRRASRNTTIVFPFFLRKASTSSSPEKDWSSKLRSLLDDIEPLGTYATTRRLPACNPVISVEGVGTLGFPLSRYCLEPLKSVATKAPYGKGTETLIDEKVRKAWQIDPSHISFGGGSLWSDYVDGALRQACRELGISDERFKETGIRAALYKMLLYETGGHFAPHRDTVKEGGMFGTLIIQLPSEFTGGAISFEHSSETKSVDLSQGSDSSFHYVAFYADCQHQLHPVESGARLTLVYNLVASPTKELPTHSFNLDTLSKLRSLANDWKLEATAPKHLGYQLEHSYTPKSFGIESLKGRDEIVLSKLLNSKVPDGAPLFHVWLLMMEYFSDWDPEEDDPGASTYVTPKKAITVSGPTRSKESWSVGMYKRPDGWWVDGEDPRDKERDRFARWWDGDIKDPMFDFDDERHCKGIPNTGNDGARFERWYYAAAIVFRPV